MLFEFRFGQACSCEAKAPYPILMTLAETCVTADPGTFSSQAQLTDAAPFGHAVLPIESLAGHTALSHHLLHLAQAKWTRLVSVL